MTVKDKIIFWLYSLAVRAGNVYIFLGSIFSEKLRILKTGREKTWEKLETIALAEKKRTREEKHKKQNETNGSENIECTKSNNNNKYIKKVWIHCASLGEFEQGRPVIEKIKLSHPDCLIFLSFFSPSGYEIQKNYDKADVIFYLPSDTPENCDRLLDLIQPNVVIFVKYEFWWNLIRTLAGKNIYVFLISAVFRVDDYFFKPFFRPFLTLLHSYRMIFVQDITSADILKNNNFNNAMVAGDTRIDRVIQRSKASEVPSAIREYIEDKKVLVYGSVWESDMFLVAECIKKFRNYIHIIAPHDITAANVKRLRKQIPAEGSLYSDEKWNGNILFINNIGMLGSLYSLAKYVYIGGGFQQGIHNILEPSVFNIPVFFGPNHKKFNEAIILQAEQIAFNVSSSKKMVEIIQNFEESGSEYTLLSKKVNDYFKRSQGATEKTVSVISTYL